MHLRPLKVLVVIAIGVALTTFAFPSVLAEENAMPSKQLQLKSGDVIAQQEQDGVWSVLKILLIDDWPNGTSIAHSQIYEKSQNKPELGTLKKLEVRIWHAPILASSFESDWDLIGNQDTTKEELSGFIEYLKQNDFPRYIEFADLDVNDIARKANEHYQRAIELGDQQKQIEAIAEYSHAIDLFPLFFEAIDNRAFTYMELGKYTEALADFELSLSVNPDGFAAFFSKGECLMRLDKLDAAEDVFKAGVVRFPEKIEAFSKYLELVRELKRGG